jgi:hypothetical protein
MFETSIEVVSVGHSPLGTGADVAAIGATSLY